MMDQVTVATVGLIEMLGVTALYAISFVVWWLVRPKRHLSE